MGFIYSILAASLLLSSVSAGVLPRDGIDYGSCTNPTINWSKDKGFYPANTKDFDHGPTTEIRPIYDFICSTLQNKCKAPLSAGWTCLSAEIQADYDGLKGQAQADAFNNYILYQKKAGPSSTKASEPPKPTKSTTQAPEPPKPTESTTANVAILFSKAMVEIDGHIDPKWWFNNKIKAVTEPTVLCEEEAQRMPGNLWISSSCTGGDPSSVPLMRAALNAMVDATIDNQTISDNERLFKHVTTRTKKCEGGNHVDQRSVQERSFGSKSCWEETRTYTVMPQSVNIAVSDKVGKKGFLQGGLRYSITKATSNNCKLCSFFAATGAGSAAAVGVRSAVVQAATKALGPSLGLVGALVTIGCLSEC